MPALAPAIPVIIANAPTIAEVIVASLKLATFAVAVETIRTWWEAKGGEQNILPTWVKDRPKPGQSGKDFAKEQCDQRYDPNNYPTGPGSEYAKIKKWVDKR